MSSYSTTALRERLPRDDDLRGGFCASETVAAPSFDASASLCFAAVLRARRGAAGFFGAGAGAG
jgi:hypothetical protein